MFWGKENPARAQLKITILYDNQEYRRELTPDWGFACLIEGPSRPILFDTGARADLLLRNCLQMGVDPAQIGTVVISHAHADHTGGLDGLLKANPTVTCYYPPTLSGNIISAARQRGATLIECSDSRILAEGVRTTGVIGSHIPEQGLVVTTEDVNVLVVGCSHPGVLEMVQQAQRLTGRPVDLVIGGMHLMRTSEKDIKSLIGELQAAGVRMVAPTHCSGERALRLFRAQYGDYCFQMGAGKELYLP